MDGVDARRVLRIKTAEFVTELFESRLNAHGASPPTGLATCFFHLQTRPQPG